MSTTQITKDSIESASYDNVYAILNDRTNIADPRGGSADKRQFVYDSDPLMKSLDFSGLPYIILELPEIDYSMYSPNGVSRYLIWKHKITVRTARDGSAGSRVDTGRSDMQNICNDLQSTFNSRTIRSQLNMLNMDKIKLTKISTDTITVDMKMLYEAQFELSYETRMVVSA